MQTEVKHTVAFISMELFIFEFETDGNVELLVLFALLQVSQFASAEE